MGECSIWFQVVTEEYPVSSLPPLYEFSYTNVNSGLQPPLFTPIASILLDFFSQTLSHGAHPFQDYPR